MVATQHVEVLVTESRESSEVFLLHIGSGRTQVIESRIHVAGRP
jgi:hypothetical protein